MLWKLNTTFKMKNVFREDSF